MPGLRTIDCFHDDPGYVRALARNVSDYWMRHGRPDVLVIDVTLDADEGAALARAWPGARLLSTMGLGHGRILENDAVVRATADFIAGKSVVASLAAPALPHPAPVY